MSLTETESTVGEAVDRDDPLGAFVALLALAGLDVRNPAPENVHRVGRRRPTDADGPRPPSGRRDRLRGRAVLGGPVRVHGIGTIKPKPGHTVRSCPAGLRAPDEADHTRKAMP